jgi:hypothetical protein
MLSCLGNELVPEARRSVLTAIRILKRSEDRSGNHVVGA